MEAEAALAPAPIRPCRPDETDRIHAIINQAAEAYRGVIPADCWHDPYMPLAELHAEMAAGVIFSGIERTGVLIAIMGIQTVRGVSLIRHAYVAPGHQGNGLGGNLIERFKRQSATPMLVGTWAAATWATGFYQRHGFTLAPQERIARLLRTYWTVSDRQIETSVVLADRPFLEADIA